MDKKKPDDSGKKENETPPESGTTQQQEKAQNDPSPQQQQQAPMQPPSPQYQGQPVPYNSTPPHPYRQDPFNPKSNDNDKEEKGRSEQQTQQQQHGNMPFSSYPPPYSYPGTTQMPYPQNLSSPNGPGYPPPYNVASYSNQGTTQMPYSQNQSSPNGPGYPPPYNVPPYSYPGTGQMQQPQNQSSPNAPGNPSPVPYGQVVKFGPPNRKSGPYESREERQSSEEPVPGYVGFLDKEVRRVFVRKVYLILMVQLLFTLGVISLFVFEPNVKAFVRKHYYIQFMALAVFIGVYLGLVCCGDVRRKYPTNIILLSIFTVAAAVMMGTMSSYHKTNSVLIAVGICAAVCFGVTLFSFHTKFDFTSCGGLLCILLVILLLFGIIAIFVQEKIMTMIYAALGAVVFMLYLAHDTQMLMGGKNVEISPEEYILAAIQLYIDVIYIFMFLLMLVGLVND